MKVMQAVFLLFCLGFAIGIKKPVHVVNEDTLPKASGFKLGTGIYDITGPAAETGMMGYANVGQTTAGLHYRLRARAFVLGDNNKRLVFVTTDSCMIFTGVRQKVIEKLQVIYGSQLYNYNNVLLSGEHTHSGPAGYAFYLLYDITSFGFYQENFDTIVNGIVQAIQKATTNFEKNNGAKILINSGEVVDANINRSPYAYLANPLAERNKYQFNTDTLMTLLRFEDTQGKELAMLNWFSVHGTSMTNQNYLISGDNKGHAAYLFERLKNGNSTLPGFGAFVGAFAQSNEGDVSPNTKGAFCDNGKPCDFAHSTCDGTSQNCHGYGPGKDDFESTQIIGQKQFQKALELYNTATTELSGPVDYIHTFIDMSNVTVSAEWSTTGQIEKTCTAALGDGFAGGTTDGPGDFDFTQGTNSTSTNPYWNFIGHFLSDPTAEQVKCQYPKPILLNTGDVYFPVEWTPKILPLQIFRVGQLFIIGVPGEFTTMSGRRLRDTVRKALISNGAGNDTVVVIAGLSNAYSHYIATYEEFSFQRYEGASTLYGPNTLAAYQQEYSKLAIALLKGTPVPPGPTPPDLSGKTPTFIPPVIFDDGDFGAVYQNANAQYSIGDTVTVIFYGANPRNDFQTQKTFLTVERQQGGNWTVILTDDHWETKFFWQRRLVAESLITITWDIAVGTVPGTYRIKTFGTSKSLFGTFTPYEGTSGTFIVK
jgi:neutral ceramidase